MVRRVEAQFFACSSVRVTGMAYCSLARFARRLVAEVARSGLVGIASTRTEAGTCIARFGFGDVESIVVAAVEAAGRDVQTVYPLRRAVVDT
jgi:hypothetical protein